MNGETGIYVRRNPDTKTIVAFRFTTDSIEFERDAVLTVEDVLPGFKLPHADIFGT